MKPTQKESNCNPQFEERLVITRLRNAIGCPICWEKHFPNSELLCKDLRIYWAMLAKDFETDGEMRFYSRLDVELSLDEEWLKEIEFNAKTWRPRAIKAYTKKTGFLLSIKFATAAKQQKHYPNPRWNRNEIIQRTSNGNALFFCECSVDWLEEFLFWSMHQSLVRVIDSRPKYLYLKYIEELGASKGKPTKLVRFDMNYDTPIAHGHPILSSELPAGAPVIQTPCYAFPDEIYTEFNHDIDEDDDITITPRREDPMR